MGTRLIQAVHGLLHCLRTSTQRPVFTAPGLQPGETGIGRHLPGSRSECRGRCLRGRLSTTVGLKMAAVYLNFCVIELSFQKSSLVFEVCPRCLSRLQALGMTWSRWERRKAGCGGEVEVTGLRSEVRESGESKIKETYHAEGSERPGHEPGIKQRVEGRRLKMASNEAQQGCLRCLITKTKHVAHWVAIT